ncbi:hypothetical protein [Thioalkalivibrio sp.]|uniref:hypothetical protein n=1 Tax=Thioalkalivibrio sp. TaxID=2093813 RepID=UPI003975CCAB
MAPSHPFKTFPVFPVFAVNSPFTGPGEGKGLMHREDREDREEGMGFGAWFWQVVREDDGFMIGAPLGHGR